MCYNFLNAQIAQLDNVHHSRVCNRVRDWIVNVSDVLNRSELALIMSIRVSGTMIGCCWRIRSAASVICSVATEKIVPMIRKTVETVPRNR